MLNRRAPAQAEVFNLAADMGGMGFIETHETECMLSVLINTHMLVAAQRAGVQRYFSRHRRACTRQTGKRPQP